MSSLQCTITRRQSPPVTFKLVLLSLLITAVGLLTSSCSSTIEHKKNINKIVTQNHATKAYGGHYKVGKPYKVKGRTYRPKKVKKYRKVGIASWYGSECGFHGNKTANGAIYNKNHLTAAHKTLPLPSLVRVKNLKNGKSIIVMVHDRGPFKPNREIDVSEKVAKILGFHKQGTAKVMIEYLPTETKKFLKQIGLPEKEGARVSNKLAFNKTCGLNCKLQLLNLQQNS